MMVSYLGQTETSISGSTQTWKKERRGTRSKNLLPPRETMVAVSSTKYCSTGKRMYVARDTSALLVLMSLTWGEVR